MTRLKKKFRYTPLSLKDILKEMKQKIDWMIDLAYTAIKFGSKEVADEAYIIEQRIHELTFLLNVQVIQTQTGGYKAAKELEPLVVMGYNIDKISDALSDIARVVYINGDIHQFTTLFWDEVPEPIVKISVKKGSEIIGKPRKQVHFRSIHGVDLIAIVRNNEWLFDRNVKIKVEDILIIKGELDPILELKKVAKDSESINFSMGESQKEIEFDLDNEEILEKLKELKRNYVLITDISETMIELALASLFFNNFEVAEDVLEMEEFMDGLNIAFEKDLLDLAKLIESPRFLTGINRIVFSCELIADAAQNIAESIIKGFEPHIILQKAIKETSEIVVRETLSENSYFAGKAYSELQDRRYKRGFHIIALKRNEKWIYSFKPDFTLKQNDLIIGLGPKESLLEWRRCVNPEKFRNV